MGTSIPTRDSPMTGVSMRMEGVFRARDRSFSLDRMVSTLTRVLVSALVIMGLPDSFRSGLPSSSSALTCL